MAEFITFAMSDTDHSTTTGPGTLIRMMKPHCEHPDKRAPNPELQTVCCYCGGLVLYERLPVQGHGPMVPWIYSVRRIDPKDECPMRT